MSATAERHEILTYRLR